MSLFTLGLADNLRSALLPEIINNFSLTHSNASWFFVLSSFFSVIAGYFTNKLIFKYGIMVFFRLGLGLILSGCLFFYLAPSFLYLLISCCILGLGFGFLAITQNILVTENTNPAFTQRALSGLHSMYGFASFLAPILVNFSKNFQIKWSSPFLWSGLFSLGNLALSFLIKNHTAERCNIPYNNAHEAYPETTIFDKDSSTKLNRIYFVIMLSSYAAMELLVSTRLTSYLNHGLHWDLEKSSQYLSIFFLCLLSGRILFSFLRLPLNTKQTLALSLWSSLFLILIGLQINPLYLALSGFTMAPFYPLAVGWLRELFPDSISKMMSYSISIQSLTIIFMNLLIGWFSDNWGINQAMFLGLFFGSLSWILLMLQQRKKSNLGSRA